MLSRCRTRTSGRDSAARSLNANQANLHINVTFAAERRGDANYPSNRIVSLVAFARVRGVVRNDFAAISRRFRKVFDMEI